MKQALVTGGAGFIGSHLTDRLIADGWNVRILDDLSTGSRNNINPAAQFVLGDVRNEKDATAACKNADAVFHLAARVTIRNSIATFVQDADTNILGTVNMLRAAGAAGAKRFVLAGSMAVYADAPNHIPVPETHPIDPLSPYGIGKRAAERYTLMMAPALGMEPVVLRLFNTYGPRQGYSPYVGVATIFITNILTAKPCLIFGDGNQCRDFVHVTDVARAFALSATSPHAPGQTLNIGTGIGTTVNELARAIQNAIGSGTFNQKPRDRTELLFSVADITRARQALGYEPKETLAVRLPELVDAIRQKLDTAS